MNIALLMHELLVEGGGERQCLSLARALAQQGHAVTVYTSAYDPSNCFPEICKDLKIIELGRGRFRWLRKPLFVRGYLDMAQLARRVTTTHEIWNPHHWPAQWGAIWLKHKLGGKVVWMCNDVPNFHQQARQRETLGLFRSALSWLYYIYDRAQNRKADLTLFLSNWAEGEFRAIYPGQTRVVRSGADPNRFAPGGDRLRIRQRFGYDPDDFVLLWLGIFMPHRRLQDAIEAVSLLTSSGAKVRLLLAGSDRSFPEYCDSLKALVHKLGIQERVTFTGKVADEEIRDFYCASDTFLFPNENQTWGLAVLEAMACGCPVLVSRGAAVHEVLTDNDNAILFPPRNPKELAQKIDQLATQPELRQRIAQAGMTLARTTYNWERFASQIAEICDEVASAGGNNQNLLAADSR
ncbi:MAG TPA: glycosyltransferase family 4 protein [Candidatus Angelobacter sp.]|nr:glycosyltransferase family 4 protein [Candidatus Angelobacter sp.]